MFNETCFLCGYIHCNDQTAVTILHTIWLRQHNRIAPLLQLNSLSYKTTSTLQALQHCLSLTYPVLSSMLPLIFLRHLQILSFTVQLNPYCPDVTPPAVTVCACLLSWMPHTLSLSTAHHSTLTSAACLLPSEFPNIIRRHLITRAEGSMTHYHTKNG